MLSEPKVAGVGAESGGYTRPRHGVRGFAGDAEGRNSLLERCSAINERGWYANNTRLMKRRRWW